MTLTLVHSKSPRHFKAKRVFVLGLGISGFAVARFLKSHGAHVVISDQKTEHELRERVRELEALGVELRLGDSSQELEGEFDLFVLSPGISPLHPLAVSAEKRGIEITNEPEIAFSILKKPVIGITGTSGKSTVTTLIGLMLKASGFNPFVGGNLGTSLITAVENEDEYDFIVAELSSYQLEQIRSLTPRVAVFTTIAQDHLERYGSMEKYVAAKQRLLELANPKTLVVLNRDSLYLNRMGNEQFVAEKKLRLSWFTFQDAVMEQGAAYDEANCSFTVVHGEEVSEFSVTQMKMLGDHNIRNLMTASIAVLEVGGKVSAIQKVIDTFPGLPHRIEFVREVNGVKYYNDSKATNEIAVKQSLGLFPEKSVIWLAGGKPKAISYQALIPLAEQKCSEVIFFGEARERFEKELKLVKINPHSVGTLEAAIALARELAKPGQIVLLSPACASFDQFKSFEHRGDVFREIVEKFPVRG